MPINVAVKEPRPRVVSEESDRDVISRVPDAHDIAFDGVVEVISLAAGAANDVEGVSVQVNRVLESVISTISIPTNNSRYLTDLPVRRARLRVW
jgi:hypothetical protein